jgi:CobQ-like glutamine amidotransferase family enzyme
VWVYPDLLSTYGDRGNLLMLGRRARLRGIGVEIAEVNSDQRVPVDGDIYLLGGGEDLPQVLAARSRRRLGGRRGPGRGDLRGLRRLPDHRSRVRRPGR